jgi:hypothetical protein
MQDYTQWIQRWGDEIYGKTKMLFYFQVRDMRHDLKLGLGSQTFASLEDFAAAASN